MQPIIEVVAKELIVLFLAVPRWDDEELPSRNVESASVQSATIGYIGDEW